MKFEVDVHPREFLSLRRMKAVDKLPQGRTVPKGKGVSCPE